MNFIFLAFITTYFCKKSNRSIKIYINLLFSADMNTGAVAGLRRIKDVISVARRVLENTQHTLLVGDQATEFARQMGFKEESLSTFTSHAIWKKWKSNSCQPNFWMVNNIF